VIVAKHHQSNGLRHCRGLVGISPVFPGRFQLAASLQPILEHISGQGLAEKIALHLLATALAQTMQWCVRFHARRLWAAAGAAVAV
jgi:hypothetical protein